MRLELSFPAKLLAALLSLGLVVTPAPSTAQAGTAIGAEFREAGSFSLPEEGQAGGVDRAASVAVDPKGRILVADREGAVHVFDVDGTHLQVHRSYLEEPLALASHPSGRTYVLDGELDQVVVLDSEGEATRLIGSGGDAPGYLDDPLDLAVGPEERVYVLEGGTERISVFAPNGTFIRTLRLDEAVDDPMALAVGHDGALYVTEADGSVPVRAFPPFPGWPWLGASGDEVGEEVRFRGWFVREGTAVAVNRSGTVVLADGVSSSLLARNRFAEGGAGDDDQLYGERGSSRGAFQRIVDLAMDGNDVYLLDRELRKIEHVRLTPADEGARRPDFRHGIRVSRKLVDLPGTLRALHYDAGDPRPRLLVSRSADGGRLDLFRTGTASYVTHPGDTVRYHTAPADSLERSILGPGGERPGGVALSDSVVAFTRPGDGHLVLYDLRQDARSETFGSDDRDDLQLSSPRGVGFLSDGRIVVADHGDDRIKVFSPNLRRLADSHPLSGAHGVAVTPSDDVYAWNEDGSSLARLPTSGQGQIRLLRSRGEEFEHIADAAVDQGGNLFLLEAGSGRVAIRRPGDHQVLTTIGAAGALEEPRGLALDRRGNAYVTGAESSRAVVYRWSVRPSRPDSLQVTYGPDRTRLTWKPGRNHLVQGYRAEGAPEPDGPFDPMTTVGEPTLELGPDAVEEDGVRLIRVRAISVTGDAGLSSEPVPLLNLTAASASDAGRHQIALSDAERAIQMVEEGELRSETGLRARMARIAFESARQLGRHEGALSWGQRLLESADDSSRARLLGELARVQMEADLSSSARATLLELPEAPGGPEVLTDSSVVRLSFEVAHALGDTASREATIQFLQAFADRLPTEAEGGKLHAGYRDSIAVYRTRERFREGFRHWRDAAYGEALEFFEDQLEQPALTDRQEIVARQVLAAIYFAYGRRDDARTEFRQIIEKRPEFEIDERSDELEGIYGLSLYNSSMLQAFREVKSDLSGS